MVVACDKRALYDETLLLHLPFNEMSGQYPMDRARPHHAATGHNLTWASGLSQIEFVELNGANAYIDSLAADTADLDFTTEDYSIVAWIYCQDSVISQILVGRYGVDLDGWELYYYSVNNTLNLRHHHASLAPDVRSGCYSEGWVVDRWHLFGISRSGGYPRHFRNGQEIEVTYDVGGLSDPDACNRDLVVGTRYTKNTNWYNGYMRELRVLGGRSLEDWAHDQIFQIERHWL